MRIPANVEQLLFGIGVAAAAIAGITIPLVVDAYLPMLSNFGVELPNLTRFFVNARWLFLALPLVVIAAWFAWPIRAARSIASVTIGVGSLVVLLPLTTFAMYYPILMLGALV